VAKRGGTRLTGAGWRRRRRQHRRVNPGVSSRQAISTVGRWMAPIGRVAHLLQQQWRLSICNQGREAALLLSQAQCLDEPRHVAWSGDGGRSREPAWVAAPAAPHESCFPFWVQICGRRVTSSRRLGELLVPAVVYHGCFGFVRVLLLRRESSHHQGIRRTDSTSAGTQAIATARETVIIVGIGCSLSPPPRRARSLAQAQLIVR
jgi:hypothetical protein